MKAILLLMLIPVSGLAGHTLCVTPHDRAWIEVSNPANERDTLWFGFDSTGSYGIDPLLCEFDLPPVPPPIVLEARFVNIPGREGVDAPAGLGLGAYQDYRGPGAVACDTFLFRFQPGPVGYPVRLRWDPALSFFRHRDSVLLCDELGGALHRVRMDRDSLLMITQPAVRSAFIITCGRHDGAKPGKKRK